MAEWFKASRRIVGEGPLTNPSVGSNPTRDGI